MKTRLITTWILLCAVLLVCAGCDDTASSENATQAAPTEASVTQAAPTEASATLTAPTEASASGAPQQESPGGAGTAYTEEGPASYYSQALEGGTTASGEIYRNDALTAAHRTLAFGTTVRVTNLDNGKFVDVIVNDRGPQVKEIIIEVSYSAAQALEMIDAGIVSARIEVLNSAASSDSVAQATPAEASVTQAAPAEASVTQAAPIEATATTAPQQESPGGVETAYTEEGLASYYAQALEGGTTASGEVYRNDALTAAHRTLAFGTVLRVTNLDNGKSVDIVVNDRGPRAKDVMIDVSYSAAQALDMIGAGIVRVKIEVLNN